MQNSDPVPSGAARLLKLPEVLDRVKVCRSYLFKLIATGKFPPPKKCGRLSFWATADVDQYISRLIAGETDRNAAPTERGAVK